MGRQMDKQIAMLIDECKDKWLIKQMDNWIEKLIDSYIKRKIDGRIDTRIEQIDL